MGIAGAGKIKLRYNPVDKDIKGMFWVFLWVWLICTIVVLIISGFSPFNIAGSIIIAFIPALLIAYFIIEKTGYVKP